MLARVYKGHFIRPQLERQVVSTHIRVWGRQEPWSGNTRRGFRAQGPARPGHYQGERLAQSGANRKAQSGRPPQGSKDSEGP